MSMRSGRQRRRRGFTLLELVTAILIVAILSVMIMPIIATVRSRLDRTRCMANLRSLHVGVALYMQERRSWPQLVTPGASDSPRTARRWIDALQPYGLDQNAWICPTVQRLKEGPDLTKDENRRIDYAPTPFDANPLTPFKWATQPWFIEKGNMHGNGNLIIFPDGHIQSLYEIRDRAIPKSPGGS